MQNAQTMWWWLQGGHTSPMDWTWDQRLLLLSGPPSFFLIEWPYLFFQKQWPMLQKSVKEACILKTRWAIFKIFEACDWLFDAPYDNCQYRVDHSIDFDTLKGDFGTLKGNFGTWWCHRGSGPPGNHHQLSIFHSRKVRLKKKSKLLFLNG